MTLREFFLRDEESGIPDIKGIDLHQLNEQLASVDYPYGPNAPYSVGSGELGDLDGLNEVIRNTPDLAVSKSGPNVLYTVSQPIFATNGSKLVEIYRLTPNTARFSLTTPGYDPFYPLFTRGLVKSQKGEQATPEVETPTRLVFINFEGGKTWRQISMLWAGASLFTGALDRNSARANPNSETARMINSIDNHHVHVYIPGNVGDISQKDLEKTLKFYNPGKYADQVAQVLRGLKG